MNLKAEITVDELLKAMKLCACVPECSWCAYYDPKKLHKDKCYERRNRDFEYYISNLQDTNEALINGQETLQKALAERNAEIERLLTEFARLKEETTQPYLLINCDDKSGEVLRKVIKNQIAVCIPDNGATVEFFDKASIKAEAIKEFAERLKGNFSKNNAYDFGCIENRIDNLVKEMVGEG